jgi:mRNA-degrading endonuclease RelE of RelBE toxin-antitoxin system
MADAYEIVVAASAAREVRRLPVALQRSIFAALDSLAAEPRTGKPLTGALSGLRSLRRGDYRVIYRIDDPARKVEVARIGHRRDVYRR